MGDLVLEERPAVLGPRQLSPVCCLGCCLPLRYADIVWSVNSFTCSVEIDFGFDRDHGVNNDLKFDVDLELDVDDDQVEDDLELDVDDDQVPEVQLAALQSLLPGQGGDPQVI